jgi:DNA-binding MarR family transcriptional regulator/N-acetylglutamate synthase-like GNAT family acetyltransferase
VLYELAHRRRPTASAIAADLRLDLGYMSRIVTRFEKQGLIAKERSASDRRQAILTLTAKGKATFRGLDQRANTDVASLLSQLPAEKQGRMTAAMEVIERILAEDDAPSADAEVVLRPPLPGDLGWVVQRHGELYAAEYRWNAEFESLVARIVADFSEHSDAVKERCWIAERGGERVGCVFLVKKSAKVAKLRLLLVEPQARGLGVGRRLVEACTDFARAAGYKKIVLWTNSLLTSARHIYERAGYRLVASEEHHSFGHDLVGETWELQL